MQDVVVVAVSEADEAALAAKFAVMRRFLNERQWRLYLGTEANALGHGGIAAVARASGASEPTVAAGAGEAGDEEALAELELLPPGRSRRPGAGRPRAGDAQPGLKDGLAGLLEDGRRGDPGSEITWSTLSLREIARQMARLGFTCGKDTIARLMREDGWSLRGMSRVLEGSQHPDRDAQFRHISARIAEAVAAGEPVISADGKKKEPLGAYHRDGQSWRLKGDPVRVRSHDFPEKDTVTISPYGVYDIAANRGFVSVGTGCDTGAFSVNAIRLWWQEEGSLRYPRATRLLITCDSGGSNSASGRLWKDQLAELAAETGLVIGACHFPPGTSKWNKIEHRLFCHITRTWRARPLMTIEDAVAGIAATVTARGLKCTAVTDGGRYPGGVKVSDARMKYLEDRVIDRDAFHGEWNYAIAPVPRPAPEPEPEPASPGRVPDAVLNHPALTGMAPEDVTALAAALEIPFAARREQENHLRRGRRRRNAVRNGDGSNGHRRLTLASHILALRLRGHLNLPLAAIAALLGTDKTTISHAITLTSELLASARIPLPAASPPPAAVPRTPGELLGHAAAAGIPLTIPENSQAMPEHFRPRRSRTTHNTPET
jgi:hypothetical protein